jgi:hypothetical protein
MTSWQAALLNIDRAFSNAGVFYALGGSAMLCLHGLETIARDLDLFVRIEDKDKAHAILCSIGEQIDAPTKPEYETKHFSKYRIENIETDLMADFAVRTKHGLASYPSAALRAKLVSLDQRAIPCMLLEDWLYLYLAIGRTQRVQALTRHFQTHPIDRERMVELMRLPMPGELSRTLREILENVS